jgi:hypothetical protein
MNGVARTSSTLIDSVPPDWSVQGVGDFNNDGKADLLWRNPTTGDNAIWLMDGATRVSSALLDAVLPGTGWIIAGVGDFNGDRKSDILWRSTTSGDNAIWLMNGAARDSAALINRVADTNWAIVGTGDYNSDYRSDILWRHGSTGANYIWTMDGFNLQSQCGAMGCLTGDLPGVPNTSWTVIGK